MCDSGSADTLSSEHAYGSGCITGQPKHHIQRGVEAVQYHILLIRGSVRSTWGLGTTMTMQGQSIGISIGMVPQTLIMSITVQKTSKYYTTELDFEEGF